jgi:hypothetical protein
LDCSIADNIIDDTNRNQVKLLKSNDLNELCLSDEWDRVKIICEQKFNRVNQFGLCFIKFYSVLTNADETSRLVSVNLSSLNETQRQTDNNDDDDDDDDETGHEQTRIGSFFAKKQAEKRLTNSTGSASDQIRALSNVADELLSTKSMNDAEIQALLKVNVKERPLINIVDKTSTSIESQQSLKRRLSEELTSVNQQHENKRNKSMMKSHDVSFE